MDITAYIAVGVVITSENMSAVLPFLKEEDRDMASLGADMDMLSENLNSTFQDLGCPLRCATSFTGMESLANTLVLFAPSTYKSIEVINRFFNPIVINQLPEPTREEKMCFAKFKNSAGIPLNVSYIVWEDISV
ncbi:MAG: hypothetical protein H9W81_17265 [Enterococcus sp.]|nr:hypothetical protein [Enterococcus sp.]